MEFSKFKNIPICTFLGVSMVVVFTLYLTNMVKTIPCGSEMIPNFLSNFVHTDFYHLSANMFALYALSRVETEIGTKQFISLLSFLLIFNTVFETILHKMNSKIPCSIGFSGVLFGIVAWELVQKKEVDLFLIGSIVSMAILPSIKGTNISLSGHVIGAVSGIAGGILWKKINAK